MQASNTSLNVWLPAASHLDGSYWKTSHGYANGAYEFFGQNEEDVYAYNTFFKKKVGGTYLEMGALDGITYSNTLFFERHSGWKGLLIEPNMAEFQHLVQNRDRNVCVNAAVCASTRDLHFIDKFAVGGIYEFMTDSFQQTWHPEVVVENLPVIPCFPLAEILERLQLRHIDFFSLDVEHAELEVLSTLNFANVRIDVIVVEADGLNPDKDAAVQELLFKNDFLYHGHVSQNDWFVHKLFSDDLGSDASNQLKRFMI